MRRSILSGLILAAAVLGCGDNNGSARTVTIQGGCTTSVTPEPPQSGDPPNVARLTIDAVCDWGGGLKPVATSHQKVTFNQDQSGTLETFAQYTLPGGTVYSSIVGSSAPIVPDMSGHGSTTFTGTETFDGGTGDYATARGSATFDGGTTIDLQTFVGTGSFQERGSFTH